jgi:hypothetical protein
MSYPAQLAFPLQASPAYVVGISVCQEKPAKGMGYDWRASIALVPMGLGTPVPKT